ncbi:ribosyldihydronicotinamide dehydrogenase [quinone]-like [Genypterus blacodes]|uniref:ribosyldihydronicotinamide dehydrogenase [quinone]-like n=1 Tax=Genypterus blacodes TaxID=154954 RepID=UPI003F7738AF
MAGTKVLIVYAHQSPESFNAAAKNAAVDVLTTSGCTVEVSDLYVQKFKAAATRDDIVGELKNPSRFQYDQETKVALEEGRLVADITEEQRKLKEADLIIFQFPMYWFSVPAIMKGWFDRVLTLGYAFTREKRYNQGLLSGKKALLSFTTGSHESVFSVTGLNGDMNVTLWPIQNGVLRYCGLDVLAPQVFWAPTCVPPEARDTMLSGWRTRLQGILEETTLSFAPLDNFDGEKGYQLKTEIHQKHANEEYGLTVGTHLGKPLPPNNQMRAGC